MILKDKLEVINNIRKLPKLNDKSMYVIDEDEVGFISIKYNDAVRGHVVLYNTFTDLLENYKSNDTDVYEPFMAKPIYKEVITKKIVGYE